MAQLCRVRLAGRVRDEAWQEDEDCGHGNGSAGFVPPSVKARELARALADHAESKLAQQTAFEADEDGSDDHQESAASVHNTDDDRGDDFGAFNDVVDDDFATPRLDSNAPKSSTVVPIMLRSASMASQTRPWTRNFRDGFVSPILVVLKEFLRDEIESASTRTAQLVSLCALLMQGFEGIYTAIAKKFIDTDSDLQKFVQMADEMISRTPAGRGVAPLQVKTDLEELYLACYATLPCFQAWFLHMKATTGAVSDSSVAKLKSMYRALEKTAFRHDSHNQWNADCVLDIVRGALIYDDMAGFIRGLQAINTDPSVEVLRVKNRFSHPTDGGWRDCMVNLRFVNDKDGVVCEVQLIHQKLMLARKGMAGHNDYVTYRAGMELQGAVSASKELVSQAVITDL